MIREEILALVSKLEAENTVNDALFEIRMFGGGPDESYLLANREGMQLFAAEMLKASFKIDESFTGGKMKPIQFENDAFLENGYTVLHYIEPTYERRVNNPPILPTKETWKDKVEKIGCGAIIVILIVATIVGLVTLFKWVF